MGPPHPCGHSSSMFSDFNVVCLAMRKKTRFTSQIACQGQDLFPLWSLMLPLLASIDVCSRFISLRPIVFLKGPSKSRLSKGENWGKSITIHCGYDVKITKREWWQQTTPYYITDIIVSGELNLTTSLVPCFQRLEHFWENKVAVGSAVYQITVYHRGMNISDAA